MEILSGDDTLSWDENGRLVGGFDSLSLEYNYDGKLRQAVFDGNTVEIKYDPCDSK